MAKLKAGDVIRVHGWPMLAKLEGGTMYRILSVTDYYGRETYSIARTRSVRPLVRHYATDVDAWLREQTEDFNWIELLHRKSSEDTHNECM
jgi:hypothetical protein